jgi:hypothetical protein
MELDMTKNRDLKKLIRERMEKTGERYAAARRKVLSPFELEPDIRSDSKGKPIKGWFMSGRAADDYEFKIEPRSGKSGGACAIISARSEAPQDFATLMQHFLADDYRKLRLRLSVWVRCESAESAVIWMRIDENKRLLIYATGRPSITGARDWTRQEVVLDVDEEATWISFGIQFEGKGKAWLSDVSFEVVGEDVPVTASRNPPRQPQNLDFSE